MTDNLTISDVKRHARVTHNIEDDSFTDYLNWARSSVTNSLGNSSSLDLESLYDSFEYEKAVIMLANHYYDNRVLLNEKTMTEQPFSVMDSIQKLSGDSSIYKCDQDE